MNFFGPFLLNYNRNTHFVLRLHILNLGSHEQVDMRGYPPEMTNLDLIFDMSH